MLDLHCIQTNLLSRFVYERVETRPFIRRNRRRQR